MSKKTITQNNLLILWNKIQAYINDRLPVDSMVDFSSDQTVTGHKTFENGITIGTLEENAQIKYDNTVGALRISFSEAEIEEVTNVAE